MILSNSHSHRNTSYLAYEGLGLGMPQVATNVRWSVNFRKPTAWRDEIAIG